MMTESKKGEKPCEVDKRQFDHDSVLLYIFTRKRLCDKPREDLRGLDT